MRPLGSQGAHSTAAGRSSTGGGLTPYGQRIGLVLSGGGARGAYEAGVLSWVLDELPRRLGHPVHFDVITGSSVGAIHACFAAATLGEHGAGERLARLWRSLDVASVYELGWSGALRLPARLLGLAVDGAGDAGAADAGRIGGMLDTRPLERLVSEMIAWPSLHRHVDEGRLAAVAIASTEIATGRTVVWIDDPDGVPDGWATDPFVVARPTRLTANHALASAAIPLLFPIRRVGDRWYCDGGLRLNTPLAPALRLGVDRLLVVGLSPALPDGDTPLAVEQVAASMGSLSYLSGKVLNALMLDRVDYDVDRLALVNAILEAGIAAHGPAFLPGINETIRAVRGAPYRVVRHVYLRPSRDVGRIAAECLERQARPNGWRAWFSDTVVHAAVHGVAAQADLLSYIFFDRSFAAELLELGRADAAAHADALVELLR